jgi:hypothetical protein
MKKQNKQMRHYSCDVEHYCAPNVMFIVASVCYFKDLYIMCFLFSNPLDCFTQASEQNA